MVDGSWTCIIHLSAFLWCANHVHFVVAVVGCPNAQKMTDLWTMHRWDIWLHSGRFLTESILLHHFLLRWSGSILSKVKAWHMAVLETPRLLCSLQRDSLQIAFIIKQSKGSTKQWKKAAACRLSFKYGGHSVHNDELQLWFQGWNSFNLADCNILYQGLF